MRRVLLACALLIDGCTASSGLPRNEYFTYIELTSASNLGFRIDVDDGEWIWATDDTDTTSFHLEFCGPSDEMICAFHPSLFGFAVPKDRSRLSEGWSISNFRFELHKRVPDHPTGDDMLLINGYRNGEIFAKFLFSYEDGLVTVIPLESAANDIGGKGFVVRNIFYAQGVGFGAHR